MALFGANKGNTKHVFIHPQSYNMLNLSDYFILSCGSDKKSSHWKTRFRPLTATFIIIRYIFMYLY